MCNYCVTGKHNGGSLLQAWRHELKKREIEVSESGAGLFGILVKYWPHRCFRNFSDRYHSLLHISYKIKWFKCLAIPLPQICFPIVPKTLIHTSQMLRLHICNSKLARSMVNIITRFVIPRFEFHNEQMRRVKKMARCLASIKINVFQQPSAPLSRKRAFMCIWRPLSAAKWLIITSLMCWKKKLSSNGNLCSHPERKS